MASIAFTGGFGGTLSPGIGVVTPATDTPTPAEPVVMTLDAHARASVRVPPPAIPALDRIARKGLSLVMPTPLVSLGQPSLPAHVGKVRLGGTALAGVGHMRGFVDAGLDHSGGVWANQPPEAPAGANFVYWDARKLPDPSTFPNQRYPLGAASTLDGTSTIAAACRSWAPGSGSDFAIPWNSAYPFKPTVAAHTHYGLNGKKVVQSHGVHFTPGRLEHMWADMATVLAPPFTILIVVLISDFSRPGTVNHIFDAGEDPTGALSVAQKAAIYAGGPSGETGVVESLGYRNGLRVRFREMQVFNDQVPTSRVIRVGHTHTAKPKVLAMTVNGAGSMAYLRAPRERHVKTQTLANHGAQRLWVLGRRNGVLSSTWALSGVVFEIRAWDKALTADMLDKHYDQLSSSWKFDQYA